MVAAALNRLAGDHDLRLGLGVLGSSLSGCGCSGNSRGDRVLTGLDGRLSGGLRGLSNRVRLAGGVCGLVVGDWLVIRRRVVLRLVLTVHRFVRLVRGFREVVVDRVGADLRTLGVKRLVSVVVVLGVDVDAERLVTLVIELRLFILGDRLLGAERLAGLAHDRVADRLVEPPEVRLLDLADRQVSDRRVALEHPLEVVCPAGHCPAPFRCALRYVLNLSPGDSFGNPRA